MFSQRCAALVAPSQSVAEVMRRWGVEGRIEVIPNGIELERFQQPTTQIERSALNIPADAVVGVFVGRMSGEKGIERLLRLYQHISQEENRSHLLLVGGGPELDEYRALANELGIQKRVVFTGTVPYKQIPADLKVGDFFVSASVSEVHPLTFIEAAAAGLPSLGIRSPGVVDILVDGVTGLIAEDNDLSFGLRFLRMVEEADLRRKMGVTAEESSRKLSAHANARRILQLYRDLKN
jgi:1,2-diacylglycerol 3-alpha-glucosyltransferase